MKKKKKAPVSREFDLSDFPVARIFRHKFMLTGYVDGGPGWRDWLMLLMVHRLPYCFYWLMMFFEKQTTALYVKLASLKKHD